MGKKHASQYANFGWLPFRRKKDAEELSCGFEDIFFYF